MANVTDSLTYIVKRDQVKAYGTFWAFTVDSDGHVTASLFRAGKRIGHSVHYVNWQHLLSNVCPVDWTHVFVRGA